jgi:hypothetical protein
LACSLTLLFSSTVLTGQKNSVLQWQALPIVHRTNPEILKALKWHLLCSPEWELRSKASGWYAYYRPESLLRHSYEDGCHWDSVNQRLFKITLRCHIPFQDQSWKDLQIIENKNHKVSLRTGHSKLSNYSYQSYISTGDTAFAIDIFESSDVITRRASQEALELLEALLKTVLDRMRGSKEEVRPPFSMDSISSLAVHQVQDGVYRVDAKYRFSQPGKAYVKIIRSMDMEVMSGKINRQISQREVAFDNSGQIAYPVILFAKNMEMPSGLVLSGYAELWFIPEDGTKELLLLRSSSLELRGMNRKIPTQR